RRPLHRRPDRASDPRPARAGQEGPVVDSNREKADERCVLKPLVEKLLGFVSKGGRVGSDPMAITLELPPGYDLGPVCTRPRQPRKQGGWRQVRRNSTEARDDDYRARSSSARRIVMVGEGPDRAARSRASRATVPWPSLPEALARSKLFAMNHGFSPTTRPLGPRSRNAAVSCC